MALTAAQRNAIWTYLGYEAEPSITYGVVAAINSRLDLISADPVLQAPIDAILLELATVDTAVASAGATVSAAGTLKKVDEIEFYQPTKTTALYGAGIVDAIHRGRMLIRRLAQRLGGKSLIVADYFDLLDPRPSFVVRITSLAARGW